MSSKIHISLAAEEVGHLGPIPITNSMLGMLMAALILFVLAKLVGSQLKAIPGRLQAAFELVTEWLLGLMDSVTHNREMSQRFFPIVSTIFLFIMVMNWLGLLPIFGTVGIFEDVHGEKTFVPLLRAGTADLNMTLAIALIAQIAAQVFGIAYVGAKQYGQKFFNLKNPIFTFVGLIEFVSEFTKVISFSFRLFGNIFAGEVLLLVIASLAPLIAPVPFYFLELFVGFIQAFVFALLALVFFTIAAAVEQH